MSKEWRQSKGLDNTWPWASGGQWGGTGPEVPLRWGGRDKNSRKSEGGSYQKEPGKVNLTFPMPILRLGALLP